MQGSPYYELIVLCHCDLFIHIGEACNFQPLIIGGSGMETLKNFKALQPLDLRRCNSVGELVQAMSFCSFGARMLGEVADTITQMAKSSRNGIIVYDGKMGNPLHQLLRDFCVHGYFSQVVDSPHYCQMQNGEIEGRDVVVVGPYFEKYANHLRQRTIWAGSSNEPIYINAQGMHESPQIRDGFFPRFVPADPGFAMSVIRCVLMERIDKVTTSIPGFLENIEARKLGGVTDQICKGAGLFRDSVLDPDCDVFLTLSGAMTVAQMGLVICEMIDSGMVQYVSSTGALMAHGLIQGIGLSHYKHDPSMGDEKLRELHLNRVTDTLEPEDNFTHLEEVLGRVFEAIPSGTRMGTAEFHRLIGQHLSHNYPDIRGILKSAYEKGVPVSVPACSDSEIGNDIFGYNIMRRIAGQSSVDIIPELDSYALFEQMIKSHKRPTIFSWGGGVPRNNTQNIGPLLEVAQNRVGREELRKFLGIPDSVESFQFHRGVRCSPDPLWLGHLSGCSYQEGGSWGKFAFESPVGGTLNDRTAEILADATIAAPFIVKYAMEHLK